MKLTSEGKLIVTAPKNIECDRPLTKQEKATAEGLANLIYKSNRNWLPVYVVEEDLQEYRLIGSPVVLEACKIAEQDIVYCILLDEGEQTETQIQQGEVLLRNTNGGLDPAIDTLQDLETSKKIHELEARLKRQDSDLTSLANKILPKEILKVNTASKEDLRIKLLTVSGIGDNYVKSIVNDIIEKRPFNSEMKLMLLVGKFHLLDQSPSQIFRSLRQSLQIDWSLDAEDSALIKETDPLAALCQHFLSSSPLHINSESEENLKLLLQQVEGVKSQDASRMAQCITMQRQNRPLLNENHLLDALDPKDKQLLEKVKNIYDINYQ